MDVRDYNKERKDKSVKLIEDFAKLVNYGTVTEDRNEDAKEFIEDFGDLVNGSADMEAIIDQFQKEPKDLQQNMFNVILGLIVYVASDDFQTDGRNKYSHKVAKEIIEGVLKIRSESIFFIPENEKFNANSETIIYHFCREHRTLQQIMFGVVLKLVQFIASDDFQTNEQNINSHKTAQEIVGGFLKIFFQKEFDYYKSVGFDDVISTEKAEKNTETLKNNPKDLFYLPLI